MARNYGTDKPNFIADNMGKMPWQLMYQVAQDRNRNIEDLYKQVDLFEDQALSTNFLDYGEAGSMVEKEREAINSKMDDYVRRIQNGESVGKVSAEMRNYGKSVYENIQGGGNLGKFKSQYDAVRGWQEENKELKESDPNTYNYLQNYTLSNIKNAMEKDPTANISSLLYKGTGKYNVMDDESIEAINKMTADTLQAVGGKWNKESKYLAQQRILNFGVSKANNSPEYQAYRQTLINSGQANRIYQTDENGNLIKDANGNNIERPIYIDQVDEKGNKSKALNPNHILYDGLRQSVSFAFSQDSFEANPFELEKMKEQGRNARHLDNLNQRRQLASQKIIENRRNLCHKYPKSYLCANLEAAYLPDDIALVGQGTQTFQKDIFTAAAKGVSQNEKDIANGRIVRAVKAAFTKQSNILEGEDTYKNNDVSFKFSLKDFMRKNIFGLGVEKKYSTERGEKFVKISNFEDGEYIVNQEDLVKYLLENNGVKTKEQIEADGGKTKENIENMLVRYPDIIEEIEKNINFVNKDIINEYEIMSKEKITETKVPFKNEMVADFLRENILDNPGHYKVYNKDMNLINKKNGEYTDFEALLKLTKDNDYKTGEVVFALSPNSKGLGTVMIGDYIINYDDITKMPFLAEMILKGTSQNDTNKKSDSIGLAGQIDSGLDKNVASGKFRKNINGIEYNIKENNNGEYEFKRENTPIRGQYNFSLSKKVVNKAFKSPFLNGIINSNYPFGLNNENSGIDIKYKGKKQEYLITLKKREGKFTLLRDNKVFKEFNSLEDLLNSELINSMNIKEFKYLRDE